MIKIMHFIYGLGTGGAEAIVKEYMLNFDRKRFDIVLLCLKHKPNSPYEKILKKNGVRIVFADDYSVFKKKKNAFARLINYCHYYSTVKKIIHEESPDVLHTHLRLNHLVKHAKPNNNTVLFHTVHNEPSVLWLNRKIGSKTDFAATKWLIKHYHMRLIVLHEKMKEEVDKLFNISDSIILNNGIDVKRFENSLGKKQVRNNLGITQSSYIIGHIGRFSKQKNHDFLIEVFKELLEKRDDAFLLMIGNGGEREKIETELSISGLLGRYMILSNRNDIPNILSTMDAFVFPSLFEGLPVSLIEAQAARVPCFISDTISETAIISNLVVRLSLSDGPKEWARQIMKYKKPDKIRVDDSKWDIRRIVKELERLYLKSLKEKGMIELGSIISKKEEE